MFVERSKRLARRILGPAERQSVDVGPASQVAQRVLFEMWRYNEAPRSWKEVGFRVYSQNEEDGLLLYVLSRIGMGDRRCIEIGVLDPVGSNTTNLIVNWGWNGLLIEGDPDAAARIRAWYARHPDTWVFPPRVASTWLDTSNVNKVLADNDCDDPVDLLSIDIDGIDYWIWKAIELRPRLVIVEANEVWPADKAVTVPNDAMFARERVFDSEYLGASVAAFVKLGREKDYRLIGTIRHGYNAIFLRNDVGTDEFPEVSIESCISTPKAIAERPRRLPVMERQQWIEV